MASTSQFLPPDERDNPIVGSGEFSKELAQLRERLSMFEQIDAQTREMLARLTEARAIATLEIATSISRIERLVLEREARQRSLMTGLVDEMRAAHLRANELAHVAAELEESFAGLQARLRPVDDGDVPVPDEEPVAPLRIVPTNSAVQTSPLPLSSLFIEIEEVPSVTVALSLQRFVAGLPGVVSALTREYAADSVRFETQILGRMTSIDIERLSRGGLTLIDGNDDRLRFALFDPNAFLSPT